MRKLAIILALAAGPALAGDQAQNRPGALIKPDGSQWVVEGCAAYQVGQTAAGSGHTPQASRPGSTRDKLRASFPPKKSPKTLAAATQ